MNRSSDGDGDIGGDGDNNCQHRLQIVDCRLSKAVNHISDGRERVEEVR
jgi:hypothetical protein